MTSPSFVAVRMSDVELVDAPIDESWILEGSPRARISGWGVSRDRLASSFVWDCTAGRFHWYFDQDETVHVVDGAVTVSAEGVPPVTLRVGDAALFHGGTWAEWHVEDYVRKHAVLRGQLPAPLAFVVRAVRALLRRTVLRRRGVSRRPPVRHTQSAQEREAA